MILSHLYTAIQASIEAGRAIMDVYATDFDVHIKDDASPLTVADQKANTIINGYLQKTAVPIISEENEQTPYADRKDWSLCWIVDPLDGTKEFVKRNGEFTVNIALIEAGVPILGVIYVPVTQTLYYTAGDGKAAYRYEFTPDTTISVEEIISKAEKITPAPQGGPLKVVGSRSHFNKETKAFLTEMEKENEVSIVTIGSSLKFCIIAAGDAHIYPRFAPTMEWDTAAGHAICNAVGVTVIDQETQKPLVYNKENLLNSHFIVRC